MRFFSLQQHSVMKGLACLISNIYELYFCFLRIVHQEFRWMFFLCKNYSQLGNNFLTVVPLFDLKRYYNVPTVFLDNQKLYECSPSDDYDTIKSQMECAIKKHFATK